MLSDNDRVAILRLLARYSQTLDFGDLDGFARCFAENGVLDTSYPQHGLGGVHRGHEALRRFAQINLEYSAGNTRQSALNPLLDGDGATARASSMAFFTRAYDEVSHSYGRPSEATRAAMQTTGMYFDELVKQPDGWVFARRVFRHDALPEVLERLEKPIAIGPAR